MQYTKIINWYDGFSKIYNWMGDYPYQTVRQEAINTLNLQEGDVVIDLFCGTGVNFTFLADKVGATGKIIGIDGSSGMLSKAETRIKDLKLNASQFSLHEQNLLTVTSDFFSNLIAEGITLKVLMILGVAGHDDWMPFWNALWQALPSGTQLTTMDVSAKKGSLSSKIITFIASGSLSDDIANYRAWEFLKERSVNYRERRYHPFKLLNLDVVVATGEKD